MKELTPNHIVTRKDAWGGYRDIFSQFFEVEEKDVGMKKPNYLGHGYKVKEIRPGDVGKKIEVMLLGTWNTWHFLPQEQGNNGTAGR